MTAADDSGTTSTATLSEIAACYEFIFRFLIKRFRINEHDARDYAQETMVRALGKAHSFEGRASLKTWLIRIAFNVVRTASRRNNGKHKSLSDSMPEIECNGSAADHLDDLSITMRNYYTRAKLTQSEIACIELRCMRNKTSKQAGEILGITPGNVDVCVSRARQKLAALPELNGYASRNSPRLADLPPTADA